MYLRFEVMQDREKADVNLGHFFNSGAGAGHAAPARAADGDYKAPNALTSKVKDSDGDYKLAAAATSAAAKSSGSVQTALSLLKTGG